MILGGESGSTRGKACLSATLFTADTRDWPGIKPGHHDGRPATTHPSRYGQVEI